MELRSTELSLKETQLALEFVQQQPEQDQEVVQPPSNNEPDLQATLIAQKATIDSMNATQIAISVQQTSIAASGSAGSAPTTTTLALPGIAPSETPPAYAPAPPWGFVQISEDFSNPNSGWPQRQEASYQTWYEDGHYYITNFQFTSTTWVPVGGNYTDVWMQTRGKITWDEIGAAYGLMCRQQNANSFYFFEITNSRTFIVGKYWSGGVMKLIGMASPMTSNAIRPYDYNVIEASCIGNELSLTVNGIHLITAYDNTYASGDIGLTAGSADDVPITVAFDFFIAGY